MNLANYVGVAAAAFFALWLVGLALIYGWRQLRREDIAFILIASGFLYSAATKPDNPMFPVSFPYVDIEQRYLFNNGSVVSNNHVHVNFNASVVLPPSAMIYLDYFPPGESAITYTNATLATFPRPLDFDFPNAVSNTWFCYTTWTPGPSVQTNGIAQISWQLPSIDPATNICAMLNTAIYTNKTKVITIEEVTP